MIRKREKFNDKIVVSPGASNCSWTSCREGCTKELYDCTQIRVNYKLPVNATDEIAETNGMEGTNGEGRVVRGVEEDENRIIPRYERALKDYNYIEDDLDEDEFAEDNALGPPKPFPTGILPKEKKKIRLFRDNNVKFHRRKLRKQLFLLLSWYRKSWSLIRRSYGQRLRVVLHRCEAVPQRKRLWIPSNAELQYFLPAIRQHRTQL